MREKGTSKARGSITVISTPLMVEESRMLQVSIFQTLQENLDRVDFSLLLIDVMTMRDQKRGSGRRSGDPVIGTSGDRKPSRKIATKPNPQPGVTFTVNYLALL